MRFEICQIVSEAVKNIKIAVKEGWVLMNILSQILPDLFPVRK
jgi:hypothetical protein